MFTVLSDPAKRLDYDISGTYEVNRYSLRVTVILDIINFECSGNLYCILVDLNCCSFRAGISYKIQRNDTHLQWSWY